MATRLVNTPSNYAGWDAGNGGAVDALTALTVLEWFRVVGTMPANNLVFAKATDTGFEKEFALRTTLQLDATIRTSATAASARSANAAGSKITADTWWCLGYTYDNAGDRKPRLFFGNAAQFMAEVAAYASQVAGTGTIYDDSSGTIRGGHTAASIILSGTLTLDYGPVAYFNRVLTLAEMQAWMMRPGQVRSGCVFAGRHGEDGTSGFADHTLSGHNAVYTGGGSKSVVLGPPVRWRRRGSLYVPPGTPPASIGATGLDLGLALATATVVATRPATGLDLQLALGSASVSEAPPTVTVDAGTTHQTMAGWEAVAEIGETDFTSVPWAAETIRMAVWDLGIDRLRLEVRSGAENDADYFQQWRDGLINQTTWNAHKYATVNDNVDPAVRVDAKFFWSSLDLHMDTVVVPFIAESARAGRVPHLVLCYVAFNTTTGHVHEDVDEYAEFLLAVFDHLSSAYGLVPDEVEICLEPDNGTFFASGSGTLIGQAVKAAGDRLATAGYTPGFVVPSTLSMANADDWYDNAKAVSGAAAYITGLSYHRYAGVSDTNLNNIKTRAIADGVKAGMSEHLGSGVEDLWADLTKGYASWWEQLGLAYPAGSDNGAQYLRIVSNAPVIGSRTYGLMQYFAWVRRGATRIGATSTDANVRPVAFINPDGKYVVVLHCDAAGDYTVGGLPAGTYYASRATATADATDIGTVVVGGDGRASLSVASASIVTLAQPVRTIVPDGLDLGLALGVAKATIARAASGLDLALALGAAMAAAHDSTGGLDLALQLGAPAVTAVRSAAGLDLGLSLGAAIADTSLHFPATGLDLSLGLGAAGVVAQVPAGGLDLALGMGTPTGATGTTAAGLDLSLALGSAHAATALYASGLDLSLAIGAGHASTTESGAGIDLGLSLGVAKTSAAVPVAGLDLLLELGAPTIQAGGTFPATGLDTGLAFGAAHVTASRVAGGLDVQLGLGAAGLDLDAAGGGLDVALALGTPRCTITRLASGIDLGLALGGPSMVVAVPVAGLDLQLTVGLATATVPDLALDLCVALADCPLFAVALAEDPLFIVSLRSSRC